MGQSDEKYAVYYDEYGNPYLARPMSQKQRRRMFWLVFIGIHLGAGAPLILVVLGIIGGVMFALIRDAIF